MKTQEEIEQDIDRVLEELGYDCEGDKTADFVDGYVRGYTQCQEDMADKKYTEADIRKAIELARETESVRRGALSGEWDDVEKYDEMDIIYLLNKQD